MAKKAMRNIFGVEMEIFSLKKAFNNYSVPPNSAPSLRLCLQLQISIVELTCYVDQECQVILLFIICKTLSFCSM